MRQWFLPLLGRIEGDAQSLNYRPLADYVPQPTRPERVVALARIAEVHSLAGHFSLLRHCPVFAHHRTDVLFVPLEDASDYGHALRGSGVAVFRGKLPDSWDFTLLLQFSVLDHPAKCLHQSDAIT